jgi:hypothetical protein
MPELTILATQPLSKVLPAFFAVTVRTSDSDDRRYGFFLGFKERARGSPVESHFCDYVS